MRPRPRPRWAALATAFVVITAGAGLAAVAASPRALAENNGLDVSAQSGDCNGGINQEWSWAYL